MFRELFGKVYGGEGLSIEESRQALLAMIDGTWEPPQIGAFLTALHLKGETADEMAGFAFAMREKAVQVPVDGIETIDTCGTGGDRKDTFNISTAAAFALAGCAIPVVKHGNRAASSSCGSADLLEALGIRYRLNPEEAAESLQQTSFAFLFAPDYHPATKSVAQIRRQLGVPTIFNLLGPLTNPARPAAQIIGVHDRRALPLMAEAIRKMDPQKRAVLLHSQDGHDEATPCCKFFAVPVGIDLGVDKDLPALTYTASDFGLEACKPEDLRGGSPDQNAQIVLGVLKGEAGARRNTVLLNALLAYRVFHADTSLEEALKKVEESIDSGAAYEVVMRLRERFPLEKSR